MKTMTVNLKGFVFSFSDLKEEMVKSWRIMLLFLLFLSGMVTGAVFYLNTGEEFGLTAQEKIAEILSFDFSKMFIVLSAAAMLPVVLNFLNSFSALGMPVVLAIPVFYGFAASFVCSCFYSCYRIDGVVFSLLLIFPAAVINTLLLLIGSNESLILSSIVSRNVFSADKQGRGELKAFFMRYAVIMLITLAVCLADSFAISAIGENLLF